MLKLAWSLGLLERAQMKSRAYEPELRFARALIGSHWETRTIPANFPLKFEATKIEANDSLQSQSFKLTSVDAILKWGDASQKNLRSSATYRLDYNSGSVE